MMKRVFMFLLIFELCITQMLFAASDTFRVRMQVGADIVPPSTPTLLSAIPVAQTQIDLSWTTASDDILLGGYQVFRDAVQIATTTLTNYSDSGLAANTNYSYFIRAFDSAFNFSTSSNSIATTTFALIPTTTPPIRQTSAGAPQTLELTSFSSVPDIQSVALTWTTSRLARFELRWGRTSSYEQGFVVNDVYKKDHETVITDLEPSTTYEFQLIGYDSANKKTILKQGTFKTLSQPDTIAPTNVSSLSAVVDGDTVTLRWNNPSDSDFSHVRVVRSNLFYPSDQNDGYIAYDGSWSSFTDTHAFIGNNDVLYYTIFSYDAIGNISSGAVIAVSKRKVSSGSEIPQSSSTSTTETKLEGFTPSMIQFFQDNREVSGLDIDSELPVTIRIPYEVLPEHLKTILVTLTHPQDASATFSFLLKVNKDKTFYEAIIAPLTTAGVYPFTLSLYDYQIQKLFTVAGSIVVHTKPKQLFSEEHRVPPLSLLFLVTSIVSVLCILICIWIFLYRRRKEDTTLV